MTGRKNNLKVYINFICKYTQGIIEVIVYLVAFLINFIMFKLGLSDRVKTDYNFHYHNTRIYDNGDYVIINMQNMTNYSELSELDNMGYKLACVYYRNAKKQLAVYYQGTQLVQIIGYKNTIPTWFTTTKENLFEFLDEEELENFKQYSVFINRMLY